MNRTKDAQPSAAIYVMLNSVLLLVRALPRLLRNAFDSAVDKPEATAGCNRSMADRRLGLSRQLLPVEQLSIWTSSERRCTAGGGGISVVVLCACAVGLSVCAPRSTPPEVM